MKKTNKPKKNKEQAAVVRFIRKSNELVEAKYKFDIWETRVFTKMLSMIRPDDEDFKDYRIYLHEIIEDFGLKKNKDAYDWLKKGARKLTKKVIKVIRDTDIGLTEFYAPIVVGVENPLNPSDLGEDMSFVEVSFHPKMKPFLLTLKSQYTTYDVQNILKLPSAYSIRIYELLKQYERIGKRKFQFMTLKETIGAVEEFEEGNKIIKKDHYPLYGNFRQRVLLKAQKDLAKHTDIVFEFEPIKKGRKVNEILFHIRSNKQATTANEVLQAAPIIEVEEYQEVVAADGVFVELYPKVKKWITKASFEKLLKEYPEHQIRNAITYTLNRLKEGEAIQNIAGYIIAMAKQTTIFDKIAHQKETLVKKKTKVKEKAVERTVLESKLKALYSELRQKEAAVIRAIFIEMPDKKAELLAHTQSKRLSNYDPEQSMEENLTQPLFLAAFHNTVRKAFASRFVALDKNYLPKIKNLKSIINNF